MRKQLKELSLKVYTTIQPVLVGRKIEQELKVKESKPLIVNQQCVVYSFQCDLCDASYVGYTRGHVSDTGILGSPNRSWTHDLPITVVRMLYHRAAENSRELRPFN